LFDGVIMCGTSVLRISAAVLVLAMLASACGGKRQSSSTVPILPQSETATPVASGTQVPAFENQVDQDLAARLESRLQEALAAQGTKTTSRPPLGEENRANDLAITDNGDGTFTLSWHYRNLGDYDQNGTVAVEDIIPLAEHFGSLSWEEADNWLPAVIDGSGNGRVGIEDITPIAVYIAANVDHYAIEGAVAEEGPWQVVDVISQSAGMGNGRLQYEYVVSESDYRRYRVTACDLTDNAGNPSNSVMFPVFQEWGHTWGGSDPDYSFGVSADGSGNVYVVGSTGAFGVGGGDVLLLKYSAIGKLLWQKTWGGDYWDIGHGISIDEYGNVLVVGTTNSFGAGRSDVALLEFSPDGALLSQRTWGGTSNDDGCDLAKDADGNLYVVGATYSFANSEDAVILKYSANKTLIWQKTWSSKGWDFGRSVAVDGSGYAYVTGNTNSFGAGGSEIFLLKFSPSGELLWQKTWGAEGWDYGTSVAVDGNGYVYVTGDSDCFGAGDKDIILLKYSSGGALLRQVTWGGSGKDVGNDVCVDRNGHAYITGYAYGLGVDSTGLVLLECDSSGSFLRQLIWSGSHAGYGYGISIDAHGGICVVGHTPSIRGCWSIPYGSVSVANGIETTPNGMYGELDGIEGKPTGIVTEPQGAQDESRGSEEALIMKIDSSRW